MSLEEALAANTAALERNSALLERVVAGQEAAIAKLESGGSTTRRSRKSTKDENTDNTGSADTSGNSSGGAASDNADTASQAAGATTASESSGPVIAPILAEIGTDADKLKAHISAWTGGTEDQAERAKRVQLLKDIAASLGVAPKFSDLIQHAHKAVFLVERAKALGVDAVDVNAAYDFDGAPNAPTDGDLAGESESESDFD